MKVRENVLKVCLILPTVLSKLENHFQIMNPGVENLLGQAQAQGFLNFFNPSPVSDLPSPNL
jgi:hypothetical protein